MLRGEEIARAAGSGGGTAPGAVGELVAVAGLLGWLPADVALVGIEVADIDVRVGLSPAGGRRAPGRDGRGQGRAPRGWT